MPAASSSVPLEGRKLKRRLSFKTSCPELDGAVEVSTAQGSLPEPSLSVEALAVEQAVGAEVIVEASDYSVLPEEAVEEPPQQRRRLSRKVSEADAARVVAIEPVVVSEVVESSRESVAGLVEHSVGAEPHLAVEQFQRRRSARIAARAETAPLTLQGSQSGRGKQRRR
jgi:hypothetical protein